MLVLMMQKILALMEGAGPVGRLQLAQIMRDMADMLVDEASDRAVALGDIDEICEIYDENS